MYEKSEPPPPLNFKSREPLLQLTEERNQKANIKIFKKCCDKATYRNLPVLLASNCIYCMVCSRISSSNSPHKIQRANPHLLILNIEGAIIDRPFYLVYNKITV